MLAQLAKNIPARDRFYGNLRHPFALLLNNLTF